MSVPRPEQSPSPEPTMSPTEMRLYLGEAWMHCNQCGGKLFSFDGDRDGSRGCPYQSNGRCDPQ